VAATLIQSASNATAGASSISIGSGQGWAAPTSGNLLVACANGDAAAGDPAGFTAGPSVNDGNGVFMWWKIAAGTETTITFSIPVSTSPVGVGVLEYSGNAASPADADNSSSVVGSPGTTTTSVSVTGTGTSGDLFVAVAGLHSNGSPTTPSWSNSFVNQLTVPAGTAGAGNYCQMFVGDFQNTSAAAASTACSWSGGISDRQELLIALKLAAAAAAAPIPTLVMARST
jgi:hypothetical protein